MRVFDDEKAVSLLYNFTLGYGEVPLDTYNLVIPLLSIDEIYDHILEYASLKECIKDTLIKNYDVHDQFFDILDNFDDLTGDALGRMMIFKLVTFDFKDTILYGSAEVSNFTHKIAYHLGMLMRGIDRDQLIDYFEKSVVNIVFLQTDSLGTDMDLSDFKKLGNIKMYPIVSNDEVVELSKKADIIITNKNHLFKEQLEQLPKVKLICLTATGYNNVDLDYCKKHDIQVRNVKGYSTQTVAQHTLSMALHLIEKNNLYDEYVKDKSYCKGDAFSFFDYHFHDLSSLTWGIVGLGNIGRRVAEIVEAFGGNVQYYSTSGNNSTSDYKQVDFDTLLRTSDLISIHAPLNEDTEYLFNYDTMSKMKPHSYLINLGRGKIVDEKALVKLLNEGHFDGVGLDVFENEPLNEDSILYEIEDMDKVILTPHVGWGSIEARTRLVHEVYLNIESYLEGIDRNIIGG